MLYLVVVKNFFREIEQLCQNIQSVEFEVSHLIHLDPAQSFLLRICGYLDVVDLYDEVVDAYALEEDKDGVSRPQIDLIQYPSGNLTFWIHASEI